MLTLSLCSKALVLNSRDAPAIGSVAGESEVPSVLPFESGANLLNLRQCMVEVIDVRLTLCGSVMRKLPMYLAVSDLGGAV
jgi:hypothetical protein